jgi:general secretion pathway protein D
MKQPIFRALALGLLWPLAALAQSPTPEASPTPAVTPSPVATPVPAAVKPTAKGEILLNFQNASLADVLNYLSEAAGFVIVQEAPVAGTVNIVSKQPLTAEDAVDLVNSVLIEKGYTAIRNGRILKIVARNGAQKQDLPVMTGSDPEQIPRKDGMVTQILPVRYVEAAKLVENLRPLLSPDATLSANEASNAILLADTQTNVHRIAQIIRALDSSVSSISTIHVYTLQYADSKSLASVITQLFATDQKSSNNNNNPQGGRGMPPWMRGGGANAAATPSSAAQQAAIRVVAVSDDQSNSVIVNAPEAAMETITDVVNRIDTNIADITETRIFRLQHADTTELATLLNSLYSDSGTTSSSSSGNNANRRPQQSTQTTTSSSSSARTLLQARVVAVADPRTNCLVVSASHDTMNQIAVTVGRLDSGESKKQHVYIHPLENADPDNVATILRGMIGNQSSSSSTSAQPTSSALNQRTSNGASTDISETLDTSTSR